MRRGGRRDGEEGGREGTGGRETKGSGSTQGRRPRAADVSVCACVFGSEVGVNGSVRERLAELVLLPP